MLLRTQDITRAADLQIAHGNLDAGAQFRKLPDSLQALLRFFL